MPHVERGLGNAVMFNQHALATHLIKSHEIQLSSELIKQVVGTEGLHAARRKQEEEDRILAERLQKQFNLGACLL